MPAETRTMYMHTYNGRPVTFRDFGGWFMSQYAFGRVTIELRPSLRAIRQDIARMRRSLAERQRRDVSKAKREAALDAECARYGYVRVQVPR